MRRYFKFLVVALLVQLTMVGCQEEELPYIKLDREVISVTQGKDKYTIDVLSNTYWSVECEADWCVIERGYGYLKGEFELVIEENLGSANRSVTIEVSSSDGFITRLVINQESLDAELKVSSESVTTSDKGGEYKIDVTSNRDWSVTSSQTSWCKIRSTKTETYAGEVFITVDKSLEPESRTAFVTVTSKSNNQTLTKTIRVVQSNNETLLMFSTEDLEVNRDARAISIYLLSNSDWKLTTTEEWCKPDVNTGSGDKELNINVAENKSGEERTATITAISQSLNDPLLVKFTLTQSGTNYYLSLNTDSLVVNSEISASGAMITSNVEWALHIADDSWVSADPLTGDGDQSVEFTFKLNDTGKDRDVLATLISKGTDSEPIKKNLKLIQKALSSELVVTPEEVSISRVATDVSVKVLTTIEWSVESQVEWMTIETTSGEGDGVVTAKVLENATGEDRTGTFVVYLGDEYENRGHKSITVKQSSADPYLQITNTDVVVPASKTDDISIVVRSNQELELDDILVDWCSATYADGVIKIDVEENTSDKERTLSFGIATLSLAGSEPISKIITVTQGIYGELVTFDQASYSVIYEESKLVVPVDAIGDWMVVSTEESVWVGLDGEPESNHTDGGDSGVKFSGGQVLTLAIDENIESTPRSAKIIFKSLVNKKYYTLTFEQARNPTDLGANYKYLGRGYHSTIYANDAQTRAAVLDWRKLNKAGLIAPVVNPNVTNEYTISGSSRSSYLDSYSANVSVSGSAWLFSASASANFSQTATSDASNSFGTFRHVTQKQIVKLHNGISTVDLQNCFDESFAEDVQKLDAGTLKAADFVEKYGTHVTLGFVLGGVMEYSMSASSSSYGSDFSWGVAVSAGFKFGKVGASSSADYNSYSSIKTSDSRFEESISARGGESQLVSGGIPEGNVNSGASANYANWASSLTDEKTWVMVDFAGDKLVGLDALLKNKISEKAHNALDEAITGALAFDFGTSQNYDTRLKVIISLVSLEGDDRAGEYYHNRNSEIKIKVGSRVSFRKDLNFAVNYDSVPDVMFDDETSIEYYNDFTGNLSSKYTATRFVGGKGIDDNFVYLVLDNYVYPKEGLIAGYEYFFTGKDESAYRKEIGYNHATKKMTIHESKVLTPKNMHHETFRHNNVSDYNTHWSYTKQNNTYSITPTNGVFELEFSAQGARYAWPYLYFSHILHTTYRIRITEEKIYKENE